MPNSPIPIPRKTTLSDVIVWFFSGWRDFLILLLLISACVAVGCLFWAKEWQKIHGECPTWAQFADVVAMVLGGAP